MTAVKCVLGLCPHTGDRFIDCLDGYSCGDFEAAAAKAMTLGLVPLDPDEDEPEILEDRIRVWLVPAPVAEVVRLRPRRHRAEAKHRANSTPVNPARLYGAIVALVGLTLAAGGV